MKSQMEIMGLAIIVVLLMIGLVFVVKFSLLNKPVLLKQEYSRAQLAANTLNALLPVNVEACRDSSVEQLIVDCMTNGPNTIIQCGAGVSACTYLFGDSSGESSFLNETIFGPTLSAWKVPYLFIVKYGTDEEFMRDPNYGSSSPKNCDPEQLGKRNAVYTKADEKTAIIGIGGGGVITLQLTLCS